MLATFDVSRETRLETDAARTRGLGYALMQREPGEEGRWRVVDAGSRFLSDTETRYATIELECLAAKWAMKKCRLYLLGLPAFTLAVDHLPLKSILDRQTLDAVENPRLQRMKAEMAPYVFETVWTKGKCHRVPDALSRNPASVPSEDDLEEEMDLYGSIAVVTTDAVSVLERAAPGESVARRFVPEDDVTIMRLAEAGSRDPDYVVLKEAVLDESAEVPAEFAKVKASLWVDRGLVLHGSRIVVPRGERKSVLDRLHDAHLGEERTLRRARGSVYWPGISADVKNKVRSCRVCQEHRPSQAPEELLRDEFPHFAFQELAADYGEVSGRHTLIVVDRWSGFPAVYPVVGNPTSAKTEAALRLHFGIFGAPLRLFTDGGLVFTSDEFRRFLEAWGVRQRVSSARYPQSNGLAESAVKTVKHLLYKTGGTATSSEFLEGLLAYRLTPRDGGRSPSEMVFGQQVKSRLPVMMATRLCPKVSVQEHLDKAGTIAARVKKRADAHAVPLRPLQKGDRVYVQSDVDGKWRKTGQIMRCGDHREYWVKMDQGGRVLRNRRMLRPLWEDPAEVPPADRPGEVVGDDVREARRDNEQEPRDLRRSTRVTDRPASYRE